MDAIRDNAALSALRAYRELIRIARHPAQDPSWPHIMAALVEAKLHEHDLAPETAGRVTWVLESIAAS